MTVPTCDYLCDHLLKAREEKVTVRDRRCRKPGDHFYHLVGDEADFVFLPVFKVRCALHQMSHTHHMPDMRPRYDEVPFDEWIVFQVMDS